MFCSSINYVRNCAAFLFLGGGNCHHQLPSNKGDLDSSVTKETGRLLYRGGTVYDCAFVPYYAFVLD